MGREFEVKFSVRDGSAESLVSHPLIQSALRARRTDRLVSTYFDTPDARLRHGRVSLRVRRSATEAHQTVKSAGHSLIDRAEFERPVEGDAPDGAWLRATPLRKLFKGDTLAKLAPVFTVEVARTTLPIHFDGATIEGALDHGTIRADGSSLPVDEFELELKSGPGDRVVALARRLVRDLPLTLSLASKAERGYGLSDRSWGRPSKDIAVDLGQVHTIAQAFEAIVQACLHRICINAALIGAHDDGGEAVHKTRIAVRHLRAALDLFAPALRRKRLAALEHDVKWISDRLGAARDADVFQAGVFDKAAAEGRIAGADSLAEAERREQAEMHRRLGLALASRRWRLLLVDILALSGDGVRGSMRRNAYKPFARRRIAGRLADVAKRSRRLHRQSEKRRHACRKRAKMLRYGLDFFPADSGVAGKAKRHKAVARQLGVIQDALGLLHDHEALRNHLEHAHLDRVGVAGGPASSVAALNAGSKHEEAAAAIMHGGYEFDTHMRKARRAGRRIRKLARG